MPAARRLAARPTALFAALVATPLAAAFAANPSPAQATCTLPDTLERPEVRRPDYRNTGLPTDHLAWVLSWSPEHCATRVRNAQPHARFQCTLNRFEFVVHGLWPQHREAASSRDHPRHCRESGPLPPELLRRHLCTVPGVQLMQQQWQAHGTCHWATPRAYFDVIEALASRYRLPKYADLAARARSPREAALSAGDVKQVFVDLNAGRLSRQHLRVTVGPGNRLREVWICLTAHERPVPTACPAGGTPDAQLVRVRPPRPADRL